MSRLFVEARAPISFNLFSSVCKRRSISPVWAEANWPNLDEPDIAASFFLMKLRAHKTLAEPVCSGSCGPITCSTLSFAKFGSAAMLAAGAPATDFPIAPDGDVGKQAFAVIREAIRKEGMQRRV
jgi:hypothetical protein